MMLTSSVNHKDSYFEYPVLTKIRGETTYETIHHLKNELKANASFVPTNLGGVNLGYFCMILTHAEYHLIAPVDSFTRPPNPGVFVPNQAGMATQNSNREDTHRLTKNIYLETLLLKQNIVQKIIKSLDTRYLAALRNPVTRKITPLVPTILDFLYGHYGRITPQQLDNTTTTVKSMTYDPSQPIDLIFNFINDLVKYTRAAEA